MRNQQGAEVSRSYMAVDRTGCHRSIKCHKISVGSVRKFARPTLHESWYLINNCLLVRADARLIFEDTAFSPQKDEKEDTHIEQTAQIEC